MRTFLPVLITALMAPITLCAEPTAKPHAEPEFKPRQLAHPFKAIVSAPHVNTEAAKQFVEDDELVLGITIGKASRAYPINMLTNPTREIINDKLGGKHIATTW